MWCITLHNLTSSPDFFPRMTPQLSNKTDITLVHGRFLLSKVSVMRSSKMLLVTLSKLIDARCVTTTLPFSYEKKLTNIVRIFLRLASLVASLMFNEKYVFWSCFCQPKSHLVRCSCPAHWKFEQSGFICTHCFCELD